MIQVEENLEVIQLNHGQNQKKVHLIVEMNLLLYLIYQIKSNMD